MRIGGIYKTTNFPDWEILVTDWNGDSMWGLIFENGKFHSFCDLQHSRLSELVEIGYIYNSKTTLTLTLDKFEIPS